MKIEWATTANLAVDNNGVLDLSGAGWATYDPGGFPGVIRGAVAGYISLDADEVGIHHKLAIQVTADAGLTDLYAREYDFAVRTGQAETQSRARVPFITPFAVPVARPMPVSIDLSCWRADSPSEAECVRLEFDVIEPELSRPADRPSELVTPGRVRSWSARCIEKSLEAWRIGDHEGAALFAFVAFDSTAARAYPTKTGNGERFKQLLRDNALVFERFGTPGLDVTDSRFLNVQGVKANKDGSPLDVADILYHAYRCGYIHGDESIPGFILTDGSRFGFALPQADRNAVLHLPKMAVLGMLAVCLLEPANSRLCVGDEGLALSWWPHNSGDSERLVLPLNEWFGRRDDFLDYQEQYGRSTVTVTPDDQWQVHVDEPGGIRITTFFDDPDQRDAR